MNIIPNDCPFSDYNEEFNKDENDIFTYTRCGHPQNDIFCICNGCDYNIYANREFDCILLDKGVK